MKIISKETCKELLINAFTHFPSANKEERQHTDFEKLAASDFDALATYIEETIGVSITGKSIKALLNGAGSKNSTINILCAFLLVKRKVIAANDFDFGIHAGDNRYFVRRYFEQTENIISTENTVVEREIISSENTVVEQTKPALNGLSSRARNKTKKFSDRRYLYGFLGVLLLTVLISVLVFSSAKKETALPEMKISVVDNAATFPKEIKVAYDLKSEEFLENSKISFGVIPILLKKLRGVVSLTAPYPNLYHISLYNNTKAFDSQAVLLPSDGWQGFLNTDTPLNKATWFTNGVMHLTEIRNDQKLPNKDYYTNFLNFKNFGVNGENFTLEADIKNPPAESSRWAHDVSVDIVGFKTSVTFNFLSPDALEYANLVVGKTDFKVGNKQDILQKLGILFPEWKHLTVSCHDRKISIMLDGQTIINEPYTGEIGQIVGLQFFFKGLGYLKNVRLNGLEIN